MLHPHCNYFQSCDILHLALSSMLRGIRLVQPLPQPVRHKSLNLDNARTLAILIASDLHGKLSAWVERRGGNLTGELYISHHLQPTEGETNVTHAAQPVARATALLTLAADGSTLGISSAARGEAPGLYSRA